VIIDPFGGAKPCLLWQGEKAGLRVNPEQAQALSRGVERLTFPGEWPTLNAAASYGMLCQKGNEGRKGCSEDEG
jgi:hypothetical protein